MLGSALGAVLEGSRVSASRVKGLGFRLWGLGFRVKGLGFRGFEMLRWGYPMITSPGTSLLSH